MINYKLSLLRLEGLPSLDCLIYSNDCLLKRTSFSVFQPESVFIPRSDIKLLLVDEFNSQVANVLFDSALINSPGAYWLPLSTSSFLLKAIPEKVSSPRILVEVHPNISAPLIEISESSETNEEAFEEILMNDGKNPENSIKVIELEQENALIKRKCLFLEKENERLKGKIGSIEGEKQRITEKVERYERLYEEVKLREDSILMLLENKDNEIMKLSREAIMRSFDIKHEAFIEIDGIPKNENVSRFGGLEAIDKAVQNALKGSSVEGAFSILNEVLYVINGSKVSVFRKDDLIYVKTGNNLVKTLEMFISQDLGRLTKKKLIKFDSICKTTSSNHLGSLISKSFELKSKKKIFNKVLSPPRHNSNTQKINGSYYYKS